MKNQHLFAIILLLTTLSSCDNFLKGADVKKELDDKVAYANAAKCTIYVSAPEGVGYFLSSGEKECRVGYTVELQYTVDLQDYIFNGMKALSSKDNSQSRADYVQITTTPLLEKQNTWKVVVKLLKPADDILIAPDCILIPKITSVYPPQDNTSYPQDTSIKIYFNKPVRLEDFVDQNGRIKNISITSGLQDLLDNQNGKKPYFKTPYLEEEGKTLIIPFADGNYLINNEESKDIRVTVLLAGLKDAIEGENASFAQNEYTFTYRINGEKDSTLPELKILNIARTQQDAINGTNLITFDEFTHYAAKANYGGDSDKVAENIQNHHVNKIWVYFEAEDSQSGVEYLEIKEQLIRDTYGEGKQSAVFDKTNSSSNCVLNLTGTKNLSGSFEYDFKSFEDGVVKLEFTLADYSGKSVSKTVDLVKDTVCDKILYVYNANVAISSLDFNPFTVAFYPSYNAAEYVTDMDGIGYIDTFLTERVDSFLELRESIVFGYGNDKNNLTYVTLSAADNSVNSYHHIIYIFEADPHKDVFIQTQTMDSAGNIRIDNDIIPVAPDIVFSEINSDNLYFALKNLRSDFPSVYGYCYLTGKISTSLSASTTGVFVNKLMNSPISDPSNLSDGDYTFHFYIGKHQLNGRYIYSGLGNSIKIRKSGNSFTFVADSNGTSVTQADVPDFNVTSDAPVQNSGNRTINVELLNCVPNPDFTYLVYYEGADTKGYSNDLTFTVPSEYCTYSFKIVVVDKMNNRCETLTPKTLDLSADNIMPVVSTPHTDGYDYFLMPIEAYSNMSKMEIIIDEVNLNNTIKYCLSNYPIEEINWNDSSVVNESTLTVINQNDNSYSFDMYYYEYDCPKYCYVYVQDIYGNFCVKGFQMKVKRIPENQLISYTGTSFSLLLMNINRTIVKSIDVNNKWAECGGLSLTEDEKKSFVIVHSGNRYVSGGGNVYYYYYNPVYFYPLYEIAKNDTEHPNPYACDLKDIYIGQSGINILADQPCFAHTMYCPRNLGDNAKTWLYGGVETGLVMKQRSFTYSNDNTAGVPAGYYYTTLVHFADGTVLMTDVKKK